MGIDDSRQTSVFLYKGTSFLCLIQFQNPTLTPNKTMSDVELCKTNIIFFVREDHYIYAGWWRFNTSFLFLPRELPMCHYSSLMLLFQ